MVLRFVRVDEERGHREYGDFAFGLRGRVDHGHRGSGQWCRRGAQHVERSCCGWIVWVVGLGFIGFWLIGFWFIGFGFWFELDMRVALTLALALTGCVTAQVYLPTEQSAHVQQRLGGETRFLKVSMNVTPFFGDSTKKLVTALEPKMVRVLNNPDGTSVNPGLVQGILQAGTVVRVVKVEFPTSVTMTERVLFTPRTLVWVYLEVPGAKKQAPQVLVLRPGLRTEDELMSELERYLTREDPAKRLETFSDAAREGVKTKTAVLDMTAEALEMAWGPPERKNIALEGDKKRESWFWAENARAAVLVDGRVTEIR